MSRDIFLILFDTAKLQNKKALKKQFLFCKMKTVTSHGEWGGGVKEQYQKCNLGVLKIVTYVLNGS